MQGEADDGENELDEERHVGIEALLSAVSSTVAAPGGTLYDIMISLCNSLGSAGCLKSMSRSVTTWAASEVADEEIFRSNVETFDPFFLNMGSDRTIPFCSISSSPPCARFSSMPMEVLVLFNTDYAASAGDDSISLGDVLNIGGGATYLKCATVHDWGSVSTRTHTKDGWFKAMGKNVVKASREYSNSTVAVSYRKFLERKVRFKEDKISGSQLILTDVMSLFGDSDSEGASDEDMLSIPSKAKGLRPPKLDISKEGSSNSAASSGSSPAKRSALKKSPKKSPTKVVKNFTNPAMKESRKRNKASQP